MNKYKLTADEKVFIHSRIKHAHSELQKIVAMVTAAKAEGDLSENAAYYEGLKRQQQLERQIKELEDVVTFSQVIPLPPKEKRDRILFGARVKMKIGNTIKMYRIVSTIGYASGYREKDTEMIDIHGILGKVMLQKKVGENITRPDGTTMEVLAIEYR